MPQRISNFLTATGGTGLLVTLYNSNYTFSELLESVDASSSTLSSRLTEAEDIGLITTETGERDGNRATEYQLTGLGYLLAMQLHRQGVVKHYRELIHHKAGVEEGRERVAEWIDENEQQILTYHQALQQSGRDQFERLRKQVFESEAERNIDQFLVSESLSSPAEPEERSHVGDDEEESDTERSTEADTGTEDDDDAQQGVQDVWGSLARETPSNSDDDSDDNSTQE